MRIAGRETHMRIRIGIYLCLDRPMNWNTRNPNSRRSLIIMNNPPHPTDPEGTS